MDEIGDLVDEIKLDDQEEEKADASANGEKDMVFEEPESHVDGSQLDSALDELGEEESVKRNRLWIHLQEKKDLKTLKRMLWELNLKEDNAEEIVAGTDDSENLEVSDEPETPRKKNRRY